ncbi:MAG: RNase adapter RapZ [Rhodospirillaceae bacterium]|nr:RNase adapter RapZ [Rhodospirillaceae bacterium]
MNPTTKKSTNKNSQDKLRQVVLVSGMSGAGKTTALKALEDLGFEAVDNIPLSLIANLAAAATNLDNNKKHTRALGIGVDIRTRDFNFDAFANVVTMLRGDKTLDVKILFVDCNDDELLLRYSETRHRHPLAQDRPVIDGINLERTLIAPVASLADIKIDTTQRSPGDLKNALSKHLENSASDGLVVVLTSFAFPHGLPREADMVLDVRFLQNPHYDQALRKLSGMDKAVQKFIENDPDFTDFMKNTKSLIKPLLPRFAAEGKSYLTIAIGCTGGRHRSVFVAECLGKWIGEEGLKAQVFHREIDNKLV